MWRNRFDLWLSNLGDDKGCNSGELLHLDKYLISYNSIQGFLV